MDKWNDMYFYEGNIHLSFILNAVSHNHVLLHLKIPLKIFSLYRIN